MPPVLGKPKTKLEWNEIDKSRDDKLSEAVDRATLSSGSPIRDYSWLDRYEAALVAFEEGKPRKLISLERSLGIIWDGSAHQRLAEVRKQEPSSAEVNAIVERACAQIRRQKRLPSWFMAYGST